MNKGKAKKEKGKDNESPDGGESQVVQLGHLDGKELSTITAFLLGAKVFLMTPSFLADRVGTSAWLTALIATPLALLGLVGWLKWSSATSDLAVVPALRKTLGRFLGDLVAFLIVLTCLAGGALNTRVVAGGAVIGLLPQFPIEVILAVGVFISVYAAWLGLETVARVAVIFAPLTVVSMVAVIAGASRFVDLRNLFPFWGLGIAETLKEGAINTGLFAVMPGIMAWKSYVRTPKDMSRGSHGGVFLAGLILVIGTAIATTVFPYPEIARIIDPLGILARAVYLGPFLPRLEALFTFVWFFTTSVQLSVLFIIALIFLSQLTGTHTIRPLVPSVALLVFAGAALPPNILYPGRVLHEILFRETGVALVFLGWVLYLVARLRGISAEARGGGAREEKNGGPSQEGHGKRDFGEKGDSSGLEAK